MKCNKPRSPFLPFYLNELSVQRNGSLFSHWAIQYEGIIFVYGIFEEKYKHLFNGESIPDIPFLYVGETIHFWLRAYQHRNSLINGTHCNKILSGITKKVGVDSLMMVLLEEVNTTGLKYPHLMEYVYERERFYQENLIFAR